MRLKPSPTLSLLIATHFLLFQLMPLAWAKRVEMFDPKKVSVAILSFPAASRDRPFIEETSQAIRDRLNKISYFHVVNAEKVSEVVNYHLNHIQKGAVTTDADRYLGTAKTHWFDREYDEAIATVDRAIVSYRKNPSKGGDLVDALLTKAMILQERKQQDEAKALFQEALRINPSLTTEGLAFSGRSRRVFSETRKEVLEREAGSLEVKTNPPAAAIYLNGIRKGITPTTLTNIPQGAYLLSLEASNYEPRHERVVVTASTTQFIERKLEWHGVEERNFRPMATNKGDAAVQDEIRLATQIGETLKVDKVVLVTAERKKGRDELVVKTIDTALKGAYNPITLPLEDFENKKELSVAKVADEIDQQAKVHVLDNPSEHLEPDTGDIRVLRRKRPFWKTPLFYSMVGAVIGGGIGATVGILALRNNDSGGGGDEGGIDIEFE